MELDKETHKKEMLKLINSNASLQSLLYDLNLLPECCIGSVEEWKMWCIAGHFKIESDKSYELGVQADRERAAEIGRIECYKTRHVTLGDAVAEAIRKG